MFNESVKLLIKSALLNIENMETNMKVISNYVSQSEAILKDCLEIINNNKQGDVIMFTDEKEKLKKERKILRKKFDKYSRLKDYNNMIKMAYKIEKVDEILLNYK
ncbi:hypothetical protein [Flavobacterium sp.]|uniref:hypothetical protein n=1 Tax=Flavobacterium sp. TaxID=239 RepID=UPI003F69A8C0